MGGRPIMALNVVNFPREALPLHYLEAILRGGSAKATEAGIPVLGGHSIDDPELKYGMVVLGTIHPDRIVSNAAARPGDLLRSEEHTSELQSQSNLVCRLLLEKKTQSHHLIAAPIVHNSHHASLALGT